MAISRQESLLKLAEEPYLSIEGEGIHIGKPMTFVRMAECNLRCNWCDTKFSWREGVEWSLHAVIVKIKDLGCVNVSLTGGEPLLQAENLIALLNQLKCRVTYLNTGGTVWNDVIFGKVDWISCDLKMPSSLMSSDAKVVQKLATDYIEKLQFKVVVTPEDLPYLSRKIEEIPQVIPIIIQPEYSSYGAMGTVKLVNWVKSNLKNHANIRVLPQLHRLIWPNKNRGV
jgi:7-carboxy-7-deazaguanine synthase